MIIRGIASRLIVHVWVSYDTDIMILFIWLAVFIILIFSTTTKRLT